MAATYADVSPVSEHSFGRLKAKTVTVTLDASYPTGGEAFAASTVGFVSIENVLVAQPAGYVVSYDFDNSKFQVYWTGTGDGAALDEVDAATDLSAVAFRVTFLGY